MSRTEKNLGPLEICQVAMVVNDLEATIRQLSSLWNVGPFQTRESEPPDAIVHGKRARISYKLAQVQVGPIELELIEPKEGESIFREFLRSRGESLHHVGVFVSDIEGEITRFRERGIEVLQRVKTPLTSVAYMDTERVIGVIVEFRQPKERPK